MNPILEGIVDLHIHAGPSVAERKVDAVEMLRSAEEAKYKAFVVKDHYFPAMFSTTITQKHLSKQGVQVFSGICLNNSIGGFNLLAVDVAYNMGAKFVCMPTISALCHIKKHEGKNFAGAGNVVQPEVPIYYIDADKKLLPPVKELLEYLSSRPDLILYTGHGTAEEVDVLVHEAVKYGIHKILVNHPYFTVNASLEQIIEWSKLGAYIELCGSIFRKPEPAVNLGMILDNVSLDQIVLDSDSGQKGGSAPVERLERSIHILMDEHGLTEKDIQKIAKDTPSYLLGI